MKEDIKNEPVEVFAGTSWQAAMVRSLLENSDIQAFLKDDIIGTLGPWWAAGGGAGSVKVVVSNLDYDQAKMIVDEYEENMKNPGH